MSTEEITSIHECAEAGNLDGLQKLLLQNPSLLNQTSDALMLETPLHIAASVNKVEIIKYLLDWEGPGKVELEAKNAYGETPLHTAAKNGCNEAAKLLLDHGVNIEARTNNSMTPLHLAVGYALRSGDNSIVITLSEYNADCSAKDDEGMIPFNYLPIGLQNDELVKFLKVDAPTQTDNSATPIYSKMLHSKAGHRINKIMGIVSSGNLSPANYEEKINKIMGMINTSGGSRPENYKEKIKEFVEKVNTSKTGQSYEECIKQFVLEMKNTPGKSRPGNNEEHVNETGQSNASGSSFTGNGSQNDEDGIERNMKEFDQELSKMVGLHELKLQLKKWAKVMLMDEKRRAMGINPGPRKPPHMAFLGNPGTGKTTVARILGKLLQSVGVLSSDIVTEVQSSDLIGESIGQTGPKTRKQIKEAMGGILFIDEAYRLAPEQSKGDTQNYGVEAMEEIMSAMEDGNIVVIFAGSTEPMKRVFSSNAEFCKRVAHFFKFDDFTCNDLAQMVVIKMSEQNENSKLYGFKLHRSCTSGAILKVIEKNSTKKLRNKLNAGLVDQMLNNARENLDSRLNLKSKGDELLTITLSDLRAGLLKCYR
ncbi:hypothetical protein ABFX02_10G105900 [Erythranthe guttata]